MTQDMDIPDDAAIDGDEHEVDPDFRRAASVLGALSDQSSLPGDLEAIVERALTTDKPLFDRMKNLARHLELYFGDQPTSTSLLVAISYASANIDGFDMLGEVTDATARRNLEMMFRRLGGLYGDEVNRGLNVASRPAEDWQYINILTKFEVENSRWLVDVELDRFDGEKVRVVGDALSMLRLVNNILMAINTVGQLTDNYPATLNDENDRTTFANEVQAILQGLVTTPAADDTAEGDEDE